MAFPTIRDLLEAGVHFGHQTRRWNPKMKKFIFAERNGIHIIDLKKTVDQLKKAADKVRDIVENGGSILFVGTKKQMRDIIRDEAQRCNMFYVNERWLGGMMTNFQTIKKNIRRLKELERMRDEGEFELRTKKEALSLQRELSKLKKTLDWIKMLADIPQAMFVVDAQKEKIAVAEANKLGIPLIALIDTNADPEKITYPVAGNDDAIRSVKLITKTIADAVLEGSARRAEKPTDIEKPEEERKELVAEAAQAAESSAEQPKRSRPRRRPRKKRAAAEVTAKSTEEAAKPAESAEKTAEETAESKKKQPAGKAQKASEKSEQPAVKDKEQVEKASSKPAKKKKKTAAAQTKKSAPEAEKTESKTAKTVSKTKADSTADKPVDKTEKKETPGKPAAKQAESAEETAG